MTTAAAPISIRCSAARRRSPAEMNPAAAQYFRLGDVRRDRRARAASSSTRSALDAVLVEQALAARRHHHRIENHRGSSSSSIAAATASTMAAVASMPIFVASMRMSRAIASICAVTRSADNAATAVTPRRVLGGDRGDRAGAVHAERGEGFQIGLDARAAARIAARDGQRVAHGLRETRRGGVAGSAEDRAETGTDSPPARVRSARGRRRPPLAITASGLTRWSRAGPGPPSPGWKSTTPIRPSGLSDSATRRSTITGSAGGISISR